MIGRLKTWFGASDRDPAPALPLDMAAPGFVADPAPVWAWLRANRPLAELASGGYILTRHADITAAFTDKALGNAPSRFSVLASRGTSVAADLVANIPPFLDKPDHVPVRRALSAAFYEAFAGAEAWVPALAREMVAARRGEGVELVSGLGTPFTARVMARFIGLPEDAAAIKAASAGFFHLFAPIRDRAAFAGVNDTLEAARGFIDSAVATPLPGGLIAHLLAQGMAPRQVADNALLVLADGIENIEAGIAMAFDIVARELPGGLGAHGLDEVVTECLRLSSPAQVIPRVAREDTVLHGTNVGAGVPVFLALGSANLDPAAHPEPEVFRPGRDSANLVLFGQGRHRCIGAPLARLQVGAMLAALLEAGATRADTAPMGYVTRFGHRWPVALSVRL